MHSGLLILIWMAGVALLQLLALEHLLVALAACAALAFCIAPRRSLRLLRRARFLLLAIVVLFGGFTPGEALVRAWPEFGPSREGIALAVMHAGRVLAVIFCVALLMERVSPQRLVTGLCALLRPLGATGFPVDRVAVRLLLVFRGVESDAPGNWRTWLEGDDRPAIETIHVVRERLGPVDVGALAILLIGLALMGLWQ